MTTELSLQCHVCGDLADAEQFISECLNCSRPFHLNPYNTGGHKDCGDAVIGPSSGIEFWCNPCLEAVEEADRAAGANDPRAILDHISGADQLQPQRPVAPPPPTPGTPATPGVPSPMPASDAPPPRRGRTNRPRRYRRIDGA
jgi:hypothetical protein